MSYLLQNSIYDVTLYLIIMSPQALLDCNNFPGFLSFFFLSFLYFFFLFFLSLPFFSLMSLLDALLVVRLGLCDFERANTEVKSHFHDIILRVPAVNMICH